MAALLSAPWAFAEAHESTAAASFRDCDECPEMVVAPPAIL